MHISELDNYRLTDAVKFHSQLNPGLWDSSEHLRPEVRKKLLQIAADFQEFLGLDDLEVTDITLSGSNAAYTYTPHSDIDLHLVVRKPEMNSEVYQELFNAKKYQYNDTHNIRVRGADVELYVQPQDQPHHSQGIYSVRDGQWLQVPRRIRANIDQSCVQRKVEDLHNRIQSAVASKDGQTQQTLWNKIKTMRQTGLEQTGEFGCDNLVFKMLRTRGSLDRLKKALVQAQDQALSLTEKKRGRQRRRWGYGGYWAPGFAFAADSGDSGGDSGGESMREGHQGQPYSSEDGVAASTQMFLNETNADQVLVKDFIQHTAQRLGIEHMPKIHLHSDDEWAQGNHSFGMYQPETHELHVNMADRHIMDILRTTAHELVHCRQHEISPMPASAGDTGSPWENQAHALAGEIMRDWADSHPDLFDTDKVEESASGYIPKNRREAAQPQYAMALSVDIQPGEVGRQANKLALKTGRNGEPGLLMKTANLREGRVRDLNDPPGPETPPTMPAGTVRVDVSDMYDWYKLGQHISNMKGLGRHDFGKGPPSTIFSFGDEDLEHQYIDALKRTGLTTTDIDPKDPKQPPDMPRQKTDPTYNVAEGKMAELDMDLEDPEVSDREFEKIYGMNRSEARELFSRTNVWDFPQVRDPDRPLHEQAVTEGATQKQWQVRQTLNAWMNKDQQYKDPTQREGFQAKVWPYIQKNIKTILADKGEKGNGDYPSAPYAAWLLVQHMDAYPQNQIEFYNALKQAIPDHPKIQFLRDRAAVNQWIMKNANNPKYFINGNALPNPTVNVRNPAIFKDAGIVATSREEALSNAEQAGNKLLVAAVTATNAQTQPSYEQSANEDQQAVAEAFDQPYQLKWEKGEHGDWDALATLADGTYLSIMFNNEFKNNWMVEFHRNNSQQVTGEGDAQRIFATVLAAIEKFIKKKKPASLFFSAIKEDDPKGSRARLYATLVNRYATKLGYSVTTRNDDRGMSFKLTRMTTKAVAEDDLVESLRREFELLEDEFIGEIRMSPTNLRAEAAKTGALAGMEFEMIVPGVKSDSDEMEPDYDTDERCRSIDDAVEFFHDGDFNGRREVERLRERMQEDFGQWLYEKIDEDWDRDAEEHIYQYLVNDVDAATIGEIIGEDLSDTDGPTKQQVAEAAELVNDAELQPYYDDARDRHREEYQDAWDESDWLDEQDLDVMSAIENAYDISWPHWTYGEGAGVDVDSVANDFSEAVGMPVNASQTYHGGRREAGHYVVEPDGSLQADSDDDTGLEFVSPPMPIDQMLDQLKKVREWAGRYGCYTNDSTGLHINVSVPEFSNDQLDYVKLALLLGDEYVLDQFGRSSNTYARSAMDLVRNRVRNNPQDAQALLNKMRGHMEDLATKAIHSGQTSKYTSINTKEGYIEFRSPGGDWLDENFDKVENTLLRFTVALKAAMDPEAYREEYLKKLYKLLEPTAQEQKGVDTVRYFADYVAGKIPRAALRSFVKQAQLKRQIAKEPASGKKYWWRVYKDGQDVRNTAMVEVVASSEQEAIDKGAAEFGVFSSEYKAYMDAVALRPYVETEPEYEIFQVAGNRVVQTFRAADNNAALAYFDRTISASDRPYYDVRLAGTGAAAPAAPSTQGGQWQFELSQTDIENRLGWPDQTGDANYEVVNRNTMQPVFLFVANTDQDAGRKFDQILSAMGMPDDTEDYGFRERARPGSTLDIQRQRADQSAQAAVARTRQQPAGGGNFTGVWLILDPDGNVIHSFSGVGNVQSDANRVAMDWLRRNPGSMQDGVTVVPEML